MKPIYGWILIFSVVPALLPAQLGAAEAAEAADAAEAAEAAEAADATAIPELPTGMAEPPDTVVDLITEPGLFFARGAVLQPRIFNGVLTLIAGADGAEERVFPLRYTQALDAETEPEILL
jgi:hypothetical protein